MRISVGAGTYVVAVSGGVDSMVLLDLVRQRPGVKVIVAHFDHGIRLDSAEDRKFVQAVARQYDLPFVHDQGNLGPRASEAKAREARYRFLERVRAASGARAIMTGHHQDDVLETAIMNMLRGTGRRGLVSLRSTDGIVRPLLGFDKTTVRDYAETHSIRWREDQTNADTRYARNKVRHELVPKLSDGQRAQLVILLESLHELNEQIEAHIVNLLHIQPRTDQLDRRWFRDLPHDVASEVLHAWLRRHHIKDPSRRRIEQLLVATKTGKVGSKHDVDKRHVLEVKRDVLALHTIER